MAEDHSSVNYAQLSSQCAKCSITVIPLRIIVGRDLFERVPDNVPEWENLSRAFPIAYKKSRGLITVNSWAAHLKSDVSQILEHDEF